MAKKLDLSKPVELKDGIHWIGAVTTDTSLHCNPYLLIDGDEAVLFDPGSMLHMGGVLKKLLCMVDLKMIKYVVVHHEDPDVCASIPLLERMGGDFKIVTHAKSAVLIRHYNVTSEFYYVSRSQNDRKLILKSGRVLQFYPAWFCHFPGAIMTYDAKSKILFTGDLFGGLSNEWNLFADKSYVHAMNAFHENYIPSTRILNIVLKQLDGLDIDIIASQHGSIINKDIDFFINTLKNLKCGVDFFLTDDQKKEQKAETEASSISDTADYTDLIQLVITREMSVLGEDKVIDTLKRTSLQVDSSGKLSGDDFKLADLERLLHALVEDFGPIALMYCRMGVQQLAAEHNLRLPVNLQ